MNGATLAHHTKLTDWCAQKHRPPQGNPKPSADPLHKTKQPHLTADKYDSIGKWCAEVNRLFIKPPEPEPPQLFRKCKYSEAMFPPNKSTSKTRSIHTPATLWTRPGKKDDEVKGAVLSGKAGVKPRPGSHARYVEDEKNTALAARVNDTDGHYVQERRTVQLHIQPEFKRKLSTGWTINRPMLYPSVPPPAPPENLLVDIPDYLVKNEDNRMEVCQEGSSQRKASAASVSEKLNGPKIIDVTVNIAPAEKAEDPETEGATETAENSFYTDCESEGAFKSRGTQCVAADEKVPDLQQGKAGGEEAEDRLTAECQYRPTITDRSISNSILNVLSVDDCRMNMRYRPVRVIDTQESMILPPSKSPLPPPSQARESEGEGEEGGPEDSTVTDLNTPIRLSQGSARTTLTPTQVKSRVNAYREMYNTYSKRTPEDKVLRPSSAAVEKAFEVLLDKEFQACQSSRRPLSCPPKARPSRPCSRGSNQSSTLSSTPSTKFQQLNATLRKQMYDFVDSRWLNARVKFQRTKNGYSKDKSAMKRARMVTSSPKQASWVSEEELVE
ncbi:uncharacterized protein LOC143292090 [Babylonia areolata]|uniref:uncharacterized protein LOC143292090 n=1 Tax=Babylonia areolata TaxID=304850 RepID=UPI003FD55340